MSELNRPRLGEFDGGADLAEVLAQLVCRCRELASGAGVSVADDAQVRAEIAALVLDVRRLAEKADERYAIWRHDHFWDPTYRDMHDALAIAVRCGRDFVQSPQEDFGQVATGQQWSKAVRRARHLLGATRRPLLQVPPPYAHLDVPLSLVAQQLRDLSGVRRKNSHVRRWARRQVPLAFSLFIALRGCHTSERPLTFEMLQSVATGHAAVRRGKRR